MDLPFELFVAVRYLMARRKQAFISLISFISVLGVAVGVMALLIALALMTGLQGELRDRLVGSTAHVYVFKVGGLTDPDADVKKLRQVPDVVGAAPVVLGQGLIQSATADAPITIKGIVPELEATVTNVSRSMQHGSLDAVAPPAEGPAGIALGQDLADKLSVSVNDTVTVVTPEGRLTPMGMIPRMRAFKVVGIFKLGLFEFDSAYGFVHISTAKSLMNTKVPAFIELRVRDLFEARRVADSIPGVLGSDYLAQDWAEMNKSLFSALWLEKMAISITIGLIVMVAALNIIASLILLVMEKSRDIAILKTMGSSSASIRRIFVLQGLIIGVIGTFAGAFGGLTLIYVLDRFQLIHVPLDVYQIAYVPFRLELLDGIVVIAAAVLICFVATIYPSRQASKLDPAQALRYQIVTGAFVDVSGLTKSYPVGGQHLTVLKGLDLRLEKGEMVAIVGASGVGKSTLLHVLGGLDSIDGGTVQVAGTDLSSMGDADLVAFRNRHVGFVFQFHHLLPEFTALENAEMPMRIARRPAAERRDRAARLLERVGLGERLEHRPGMLSGGEQQRVAIARALVMDPSLLLADEPTGDLDEHTAESFHELLRGMHSERGLTSVIATHNPRLAAACDRVLRLEEGRLRDA